MSNLQKSRKFTNILQKRMRELAFLNKGINIVLIDDTGSKKKEYPNKYDGGVSEFVRFINKKKPKIHYVIGTRFQKFSIILKRLLPDLIFEKILIKYNKL